MKCFFIYNPKSGKGIVLKNLPYIRQKLNEKFDEVVIYESKSKQDLEETVKIASTVYDVIVFSGGDGTFNDVANAICECDKRPILGYLPLGTANDIARNLKIPRSVKGALKVVCNGLPIEHDVGKINDRYFIYVAGIGVCTDVSYRTDHKAKKVLGRFAYVLDGFNKFFTSPLNKIKITTETEVIEENAPLVLVLNSMSVGGIRFHPYGHLNDGTFDIIVVKEGKDKGRFNVIKLFIGGLLGFRKKSGSTIIKSSKFTIEVSDEATWCTDGEEGPKGTIYVENIPHHLQILAPRRKAKRQRK